MLASRKSTRTMPAWYRNLGNTSDCSAGHRMAPANAAWGTTGAGMDGAWRQRVTQNAHGVTNRERLLPCEAASQQLAGARPTRHGDRHAGRPQPRRHLGRGSQPAVPRPRKRRCGGGVAPRAGRGDRPTVVRGQCPWRPNDGWSRWDAGPEMAWTKRQRIKSLYRRVLAPSCRT
jgi:hypothetical protein